jgi:tetratricopeptide (TPR) repeat protein
VSVQEKVKGAEHIETAVSLNGLADLLQRQGDLAAARPLYERTLAIREKVAGPEHPATATALNNLGRLFHDQGDLAAAQPLLKRALAIREKVLGSEHPETAGSLNNLGRGLLARVSAGIALNEPDADGATVRGMAQFSWPNQAMRLARHWAPLNLPQ